MSLWSFVIDCNVFMFDICQVLKNLSIELEYKKAFESIGFHPLLNSSTSWVDVPPQLAVRNHLLSQVSQVPETVAPRFESP